MSVERDFSQPTQIFDTGLEVLQKQVEFSQIDVFSEELTYLSKVLPEEMSRRGRTVKDYINVKSLKMDGLRIYGLCSYQTHDISLQIIYGNRKKIRTLLGLGDEALEDNDDGYIPGGNLLVAINKQLVELWEDTYEGGRMYVPMTKLRELNGLELSNLGKSLSELSHQPDTNSSSS